MQIGHERHRCPCMDGRTCSVSFSFPSSSPTEAKKKKKKEKNRHAIWGRRRDSRSFDGFLRQARTDCCSPTRSSSVRRLPFRTRTETTRRRRRRRQSALDREARHHGSALTSQRARLGRSNETGTGTMYLFYPTAQCNENRPVLHQYWPKQHD